MEPGALFWLAVKAVAIAALPLAYVALSRAPDKFRKLAWVTAFLTFDLILFGAFTRLTDSGLGCPDWPGCYGHSNPLSAGESIRAAETAQPTGPVTMTKAWIEMLHRYFAMAVGFLIVVLMALAWRRWWADRRRSPWLATLIFFAVCLQGAFGAWTVTMKLQPLIVTAHLLGGLTLLALLVWLALREDADPSSFRRGPESSGFARGQDSGFRPAPERQVRSLAALAFVLLYLQIALGGWVSTNYAVLACPDFPLCQGQWLPPMNFAQGFTLWRDLGETASGEPIVFAALVAIHWTHRHFAYLVFAVLGVLAWRLWRVPGCERLARALAALLLAQFATGVSNVVFDWPLAAALLHTGGAALLVALLVAVNFRLARAARAAVPA